MDEQSRAIVLVSGGMDSCVTATLAKRENGEVALLHVSYGQRTEKRELRAFNEIAERLGAVARMHVPIDYLVKIGGSSLTDRTIEVSDADLESDEIPSSYVPFRNANLLSIATSWAEVISANRIYIGVVAEDSSGYPDCRPEFIEAFERLVATGTKPGTEIRVMTPLIDLSKAEIVKKGIELGAPLELSWSCYQNEDKACGRCDSCALRLRGFAEAGIADPIEYV
ncbi:MAG: 7-cyano-7-deazaguanine synthase QueC [Pyrinomonadaceae bacterium]